MLKSAITNAERADAYAREFKCLTRPEQKLICTLCSTEISYGMRSRVIQQIKTERHKSKQQLSERQTLLSNCPQTNYFAIDLCNEFLSANLPMENLGNTQLETFLEKYTKNVIPTPSNIRNNYNTSSYEKTGKFASRCSQSCFLCIY